MLLVLTVLLGIAYPLVVTGIGQVVFKHGADGSLVESDGTVVGSELIGQAFEGAEWFVGRPDAYDPAASAPANLGPSNPELAAAVTRARRRDLGDRTRRRARSPWMRSPAAAAGSIPHISPAYAALQAPRVAEARGLELDQVLALIDEQTEGRTFGFLGEPRVNVLLLNLGARGASLADHEARPAPHLRRVSRPGSARPSRCWERGTAAGTVAPTWSIGFVETPRPADDGRRRSATSRSCRGARIELPRCSTFEEMDVDAIIARAPEVVLVDELAHTNVPGSAAREALAGRRRDPRSRDRCDLHGQHPAPRVAERRRGDASPGSSSARRSPTRSCGPRISRSWST